MSGCVLTTAAGARDVLGGGIRLPVLGIAQGELEVDADATLSGPCTVAMSRDDGGRPIVFNGTLALGSTWQGRGKYIVIGGAGGLAGELATPLDPRNYEPSPLPVLVSTIVADIAEAAGETLDASVIAGLGALVVPRWLRAAELGAVALGRICDAVGLGWRIQLDGTLWVGVDTWPAATAAQTTGLYQQGDDGVAGVLDVAQEVALLAPGMTVLGQQLVEVVYQVSPGGARAELHYGGTVRDALKAAVLAVNPPSLYALTYPATVCAQDPETGAVDLLVDDVVLGKVNAVPLRSPVPAGRLVVDDGFRVRLRFENASPAAPFAEAFDANPAASRGVARVGDTTGLGKLTAMAPPAGGPVVFTWQPPGEPPPAPVVWSTALEAPDLVALISSGSGRVLLNDD